MRIAIAGPGRSGTSVLVKILESWGLSVPDGVWHEDAAAGFEARLGSRPDVEVEKDPWAFEYIDRLDPEVLASYSAFIVPVRRRKDAAVSRSVQERLQRAIHGVDDSWRWDTWGWVAGGAVVESTAEAVSASLGRGLWDLLEVVAAAGLQPIILQFPRFVNDFDYLWAHLGPVVSERIDEDAARQAWSQVADPSRVRISTTTTHDIRVDELEALVEALRTALRQTATQRDVASNAVAHRDQELLTRAEELATRDRELRLTTQELQVTTQELQLRTQELQLRTQELATRDNEVAELYASRSWRLTRPLRSVRAAARL